MRYLSVCSGIEAASVAWGPLGFAPVAFSEVDPFPCAVLAHHYPAVPNWGDLTRFKDWPNADIDLLVGGTPCQSFSVAGLRAGLADPRGNLALTYLACVERYRPRWVVWENVPGVLSSTSHDAPDPCPPTDDVDEGTERVVEDEYDADESHAFACFLAGLSELGYGFAYGSLDAQYAGLAQRRVRVFVVGHLGDWRRAAAVLFERESLSGHPAPRRDTGEGITGTLAPGAHPGGYNGQDAYNDLLVAHALRADGFDASEDGTGRGTPIVPTVAPCLTGNYGKQPDSSDTSAGPMLIAEPFTLAIRGRGDSHDLEYRQDGIANAVLTPNGGRGGIGVGAIAFSAKDHGADAGNLSPTLRAGGFTTSHANGGCMPAVAFDWQSGGDMRGIDPRPLAQMQAEQIQALLRGMQVRRLTPRECERLQGFPDDYTLIPYRGKPAADGPRYKALGNSMAVPVMAWIGRRIALVDALPPACGVDGGRPLTRTDGSPKQSEKSE